MNTYTINRFFSIPNTGVDSRKLFSYHKLRATAGDNRWMLAFNKMTRAPICIISPAPPMKAISNAASAISNCPSADWQRGQSATWAVGTSDKQYAWEVVVRSAQRHWQVQKKYRDEGFVSVNGHGLYGGNMAHSEDVAVAEQGFAPDTKVIL